MDIKELKEDVINKYSNLSLDDKRNEFNQELIIISKMADMLANGKCDVEYPENYHKGTDLYQTEDEFLTANYSGLMEVKNNLINILDSMTK